MPLGRSVINDQVLPFDPAMIAQAVLPHFEEWQVFDHGLKIADPTTCPLRQRMPWRNQQRRTGRNELSPLHSILIAGGRRSAEYHVSMVVALTAGTNTGSQMRCAA